MLTPSLKLDGKYGGFSVVRVWKFFDYYFTRGVVWNFTRISISFIYVLVKGRYNIVK